MREFYWLMKQLSTLIKDCQATGVLTGATEIIDISAFPLRMANKGQLPDILDPIIKEKNRKPKGKPPHTEAPTMRKHTELIAVHQTMYLTLDKAIR